MKVGILGCGGIARSHVAAWKANNVEVAAVCDVRRETAEALAETCGAEQVFTDAAALAGAGINAVSVCTPPGTHLDLCKPFLEAGIPILCEKPLTATQPQAQALAQAVRDAGTPFMTAFCHRWHPGVVKLKGLIDEGKLGEIAFFRNIFSGLLDLSGDHRSNIELSGGGSMIDTSSHSVDLFRHLVGDVDSVSAVTANVGQDIPVEDLGAITLTSGTAVGICLACHSVAVGTATVHIHGTEGNAILNYGEPNEPDLKIQLKGEKDWTPIDCSGLAFRFTGEVAAFKAVIEGREEPSATIEDGLATTRIMSAAYAAAETGARIAM